MRLRHRKRRRLTLAARHERFKEDICWILFRELEVKKAQAIYEARTGLPAFTYRFLECADTPWEIENRRILRVVS